jgi:hypothetical protein
MLSSVLVLAVVTAADPLRLIATFVVISRPRPAQNLLAYLIGCAILNTFVLLIPLLVLHYTDLFSSLLRAVSGSPAAGGSAVQPVPIAMGVLSLVIAAVMMVRLRVRQDAAAARVHQEAPLRPGGGATAVSVLDEDSPTPTGFTETSAAERSVFRRLALRIHTAWRNGATWVSVLMGLTYSPVQVTIALTIIATSGAGIGTQLGTAIAFLVVILAIVEIILVSCVIAPARTQSLLRPLHAWVEARRPQVLAAAFALVGLSLLATGANVF